MNLTGKFITFNFALMTIVVTLGGTSVWNAYALVRASQSTTAEYEAVDLAQTASTQVFWFRSNLRGAGGNVYRDVKYFDPIRKDINDLTLQIGIAGRSNEGPDPIQTQLVQEAAQHLDKASKEIDAHPDIPAAGQPDVAVTELEAAEKALNALYKLAPSSARRHAALAAAGVHDRMLWTCLWLVITLGLSSYIHMRQYRALVRPLLWLHDDMRQSVTRQYHQIASRGEGEFREVAAYFNGLARELADLYRSMEEKIIARSRELVRSERLASVGFLAAGVAHEINNPLSVISGYAELAFKDIQRVLHSPASSSGAESDIEAEADALSNAIEAQTIIREEAFRCKEITSRLLSLARGGGDGREVLSLVEMAAQVATLTKGLKNYRNRKVTLVFDDQDPLQVSANPTEMKQVLLNLTVNALEAVPERGKVSIGGRRDGPWIEIFVEDDGKGMTPEILNQIFEPFFTAKRGSNEPGTGLGLSITHAIIENHGGRIRAESAGPGRGSRFTVKLPSVKVPALNGKALVQSR